MFFKQKQTDFSHFLNQYPIENIQFDEDFRLYHIPDGIKNALPTQQKKIYWIGSCHRNGYVREEYLRLILENFEESDINRVLMRLLDWVPEISAIANDWLVDHFANISVVTYLGNMPLLVKLHNSPRTHDLSSLKKITEYLVDHYQTHRELFEQVSNPKWRRFLLQLFSTHPRIDLYKQIASDPDPLIRRLAFAPQYHEQIRDYLDDWIKDKSVLIKLRLIRDFLSADVHKYSGILHKYQEDRNMNVRSTARFYLKRDCNFDGYEYYKTTLKKHPDIVLFLADYAKKPDAPLFLEGLSNARKLIVLAALRALAQMNELSMAKGQYFQLLERSGRIAKYAAHHISPHIPLSQIMQNRTDIIEKNSCLLYVNIICELDSTIGLREAMASLMDVEDGTLVTVISTYVYWASWQPDLKNVSVISEIRALAEKLFKIGRISDSLKEHILFITKT